MCPQPHPSVLSRGTNGHYRGRLTEKNGATTQFRRENQLAGKRGHKKAGSEKEPA